MRLMMLAAAFVAAMVGWVPAALAQPVAPTITFGAAPTATYLGGNFTVSAVTNSDGALAYSAVSGPCAVVSASAGLFRSSGTGACVVQAATALTATYLAGFAQQTVTIGPLDLWAVAGTTTLPDGAAVTVWGYNVANTAVTRPGGPTLIANQGDTVTIPLHNALTANTALLIQGQDMVPDTTGVAPGGMKTYTFTASRPGTYLYEAGLLPNAQHQVAMGLYGALIVRPAGAPLQGYADAATGFTAASDEAVLLLSEIDPALNASVNPAAFDMRDFAPRYFLINGKAYPATDSIASASGSKVLLRYVNAGVKHHSMGVLGLRQNFVAKDGGLLPTLTHNVAAETLAPGQTGDAIATLPAVTSASRFAVYDANLMLRNGSAPGFGGMLTFVTAGVGAVATGPTASAVTLTPNATNGSADVALSASFAPATTAAEYFIDTTGANGSGIPMGGAATARTATIPAATLAGLPSGNHTIIVHGTDGTTWGGFSSAVLKLDKVGPTTNGLSLTPNPSNGTVSVALHANADDTATGGTSIAAAEYFVGPPGANGTGTVIPVSAALAPVKSLDKTIAPPVSGGVISVHSQDALGNWGPFATITLTVVAAGPNTTGVTASKNPNNGTVPFSSSVAAVRVSATIASGGSTVALAEGFIDTVGANGTGFQFVPSDGAWNSATESVYGDIPLANVGTLSNGNHTIYVHGKDAAGNWGPTSSTILLIDKTAPTVSVTPAVSTAAVGGNVILAVAANDVGGSGVSGGQYWVDGSATPPASPTAFTGSSITLNGLAAGAHTAYVRVQDGATNWSAVSSVTVYVVQAVNDPRSFTANTSATQTNDAPTVLTNDQPTGVAGRTVTLATAPVRTAGAGVGTITLSCNGGTPATPAVSGNTICTNGTYRVTLATASVPALPALTLNARRQAAKRGTYQFTYTETLNGVSSTATVTITVQ
jgi:FtsP/CotA-like multicopper oxidase with cupredoxin domain